MIQLLSIESTYPTKWWKCVANPAAGLSSLPSHQGLLLGRRQMAVLLTSKFQVTCQVLFTPPWWQLAKADISTVQQAETETPNYPARKFYNSLYNVHLKDLLFGLKLGKKGKSHSFLFL